MQTDRRFHALSNSKNSLVRDMTTEQLQTVIQIAVEELLLEFLGDPDRGLELKAGLLEHLSERRNHTKEQSGLSTSEVLKILELN